MKPSTARKIHRAIKCTGVSLVFPKIYKELGETIDEIEAREKYVRMVMNGRKPENY